MIKMNHFSILLLLFSFCFATIHAEKPSDPLLNFTKSFEGFLDKPRNENNGKYSIGHGHDYCPGTESEESLRKFLNLGAQDPISCTTDQAHRLIIQDYMETYHNISNIVKKPIQDYEYDAFRSLAYNIGRTAFVDSEVVKKFNIHGSKSEEPLEYFGHWRCSQGQRSRGLMKRRFGELFVFANKAVDPEDKPSDVYGIPMPVTNENWSTIDRSHKDEAIRAYRAYFSA